MLLDRPLHHRKRCTYLDEELFCLREFGVADVCLRPGGNEDHTVAFFSKGEGVGEEVVDHEGLVEVDQVVGSLGERDGRRTTVFLFLHRRLWWEII